MRADSIAPCEVREALMAQVPDREGAFVKVPKITNTGDAAATAAAASSTDSGDDAASVPPDEVKLLGMLDIRVGRVLSVEPHPDADR